MCHPEVPAGQVTPQVTRDEVNVSLPGGEQMPALLTRPEGGDGPAVLIVADIFGRSPFYEDLAARLAQAGFVALCPDYFFRQGPLPERTFEAAFARRARLNEKHLVADMSAAVDWLKGQEGVRGERVGTVGFCMGGTITLDLAAERGDVVTVSYYGFPAGAGAKATETSAPAPLAGSDRMQGPILGWWGDQDSNVGIENVEKLAEQLKSNPNATFEYKVYPGLGHGFLAASRFDPNSEAYEAACESWARTLDFYRQHLAVGAAA